jgi:hypothetical protein
VSRSLVAGAHFVTLLKIPNPASKLSITVPTSYTIGPMHMFQAYLSIGSFALVAFANAARTVTFVNQCGQPMKPQFVYPFSTKSIRP